MRVSIKVLIGLAAVTWFSGAVVLFLKGSGLLLTALAIQPGTLWPYGALLAGLLIGVLKARFIFTGSCRRNLARIKALPNPKPWQFFRPGFFVFLITMIIFGSMLSRLALESFPLLITMIIVDFSLAIALSGSSHVFWKRPAAGTDQRSFG